MGNCFQKIVKSWQTILFFAILFGSSVFVGSVFGLGGYIGETDLLVVANSQNVTRNYNYGDLGQTLKIVLKEETFNKLLKEKFNLEIDSKDIKIRHYKKTDILRIKVKAHSVVDAQNKISVLHQAIVSKAPEYYAKSDKTMVKTLKKPQVIDSYTLARQRGLFGLGVGFFVGLFVVWLTDFRLNLFSKDRSSQAIVRQKLKKELENSTVQKELKPEVDEYVFSAEGLLKNGLAEKSERNKPFEFKKETEKILPKKQGVRTSSVKQLSEIKPRVISLNTFVEDGLSKKVKKQPKQQLIKKAEKEVVPDNLPIFVEDKYNNEIEQGEIDIQEKVPSKKEKKTVTERVVSGKERKTNKTKESGDSVQKKTVDKQKVVSNVEPHEIRKPNAHNIANGFTPPIASDIPSGDEDLTPEEIKDRLNRLLRGDL